MFIYTVLLYRVTWPDDYLIYDIVTLTDILITWLWYVYIWYLISDTGTWHVITRHLIPDTWYLISILDMLSPDNLITDTWYMTLDNWRAITHLTCYHLVLIHLTRDCDTWLDTITPDTCISLHIYDYHFFRDLTWLFYIITRHLVLLNSCAPELLYTWTPEKGRLMILYSCWSP